MGNPIVRSVFVGAVASNAVAGCAGESRHSEAVDVLVIGAGASGLAAAGELQREGLSVVVLEARDRIGGRIAPDRGLGVPIDLGAAWIHGTDDNPIADIADELALERVVSDWENVLVHGADGLPYDEAAVVAAGELYDDLLDGVWEAAASSSTDVSLGQGMSEAIAAVDLDEDEAALVDWSSAFLENDYAEDLDVISVQLSALDDEVLGDEVLLPSSFDPIVQQLAEGIDIRLEEIVTDVDWTEAEVAVTTSTGEYHADRVVITLPLGVLQAGAVSFEPPLPAEKLDAMDALAMGAFEKVVLSFDTPFWPEDYDGFGQVSDDHGFPLILDAGPLTGAPILIALTQGSHARELADRSDAEVVDEVLAIVDGLFSRGAAELDGFVVTRWFSDPFTLGAYSYGVVGGSVDARDMLAAPVDDRLFFAGEATHASQGGTVHGAYRSGLRAAEELLDSN